MANFKHRRLVIASGMLSVLVAGGAAWWLTRGCNPMDYAGTCVEDSGNPRILDAAPAEGDPAGGNAIEINGKHFGPGIQVWFGDQPATQVKVINSVRVKAVVPAGGKAIEINGKHFGPGIQVWFGDQPATQVKVINSVRVKAVVPAGGTPHLVDISISRNNGPKAVLPGGYRYDKAMVVDSVTPLSGPAAGGTKVVIRGQGFAPDTRVDFGGAASQIAEYQGPATIIATTTPHQPGPAVINIRTGEDEQTYPGAFTYK
jgi:hypothetical protein